MLNTSIFPVKAQVIKKAQLLSKYTLLSHRRWVAIDATATDVRLMAVARSQKCVAK